jgi:eukaryotic-like serine/threonine-protein kinase
VKQVKPERWHKVKELLASALELEPEERASFLKQACGDDEELGSEVESLLSSHEPGDSFMETPAVGATAKSLVGEPVEPLIGQYIGPYEIISELGRGGMGDVYLAQDGRLRRPVALKLLPQHFTIDVERVRRFEQEAHAASALNHPNIVTIHEIGHTDSIHFITTEFIDGMTLRDRIAGSSARVAGNGNPVARRALELSEALDIAAQIASALTVAHDAGIVHRDIKPENVMLRRDGFVKVLDFGLAKLKLSEVAASETGPSDKLRLNTQPGMVMGTVQYMSPEQARGQEVDPRTDIWSLGVVLYEMVTGRVPFGGETPSHVIVSILESQAPRIAHDREVPAELEEIVSKALRKDREQRYQTADDLALDLKSLKQDLEVEARLKHSLKPDSGTSETVTRSVGHTSVETVYQPEAGTVLATASPTSSAEYLVAEINGHKRGVVLAAAVMILVFTALTYSFYLKRNERIATDGESINSLAVLPFVDESGDPNTEYLADGISDSVINSLSRLPKLRVISRSAIFRYKGKQPDPQAAGRDFNVRAVLMGRMTQRGDNLTISTELVDVSDNRRLWGEQYNRKLSDVLLVQDEIARKISEGLRLRLSGEEKKQLEKQYTGNNEAYLLYNLGRYYSEKFTKEGLEKGIEYYERAIKVDPTYALAYVGLSSAYHDLSSRGFEIPKETLRKREWAALRAVELDDTLSEAHAALAVVKAFRLDWAGAEKESKRALELDQNSFDANRRYASNLAHEGRSDEALVYAKRAYELDQTRSGPASVLGYVYFLGRQYDNAIELYLKAVEKSPDNPQTHSLLGETYVAKGMYKEGIAELQKAVALDNAPERWDRSPVLAYAYAVSGQRDEALKILAEQKRLAKQRYIGSYNFAVIYTGLDDKDRAFEYLNKSYDEGRPLIQVPSRPLFDSLRSDPRYTELLRRIGRAQ